MLIVLALLAAGVVGGILLRGRPAAHALTPRLTTPAVYLLLFLLGVDVASDERIVANIVDLGLPALLISLAGILGSCLATRLIPLRTTDAE